MTDKKDAKKEWEEKNNIKIAIIEKNSSKMTIKQALEKIIEKSSQQDKEER